MNYLGGGKRELYISWLTVRFLEPTVNWGGLGSRWGLSRHNLGRRALSAEPIQILALKMDKILLCNFTSVVVVKMCLYRGYCCWWKEEGKNWMEARKAFCSQPKPYVRARQKRKKGHVWAKELIPYVKCKYLQNLSDDDANFTNINIV